MKKVNLIFVLLFLTVGAFAQQDKKEVTLEDIWVRYRYFPQSAQGFRWMNDDQYYTTLERGSGIKQNNIEDEKDSETLLDFSKLSFESEDFSARSISGYRFSEDESKLLLVGKKESVYRRSSKEVCYVYDRKSEELILLHEGKKVGNATFSPDASKIAYTFDNNLYYHDFAAGEPVQVTFDGKWNDIINGSTDWVYEEELTFVKAFAWSPDNAKLAFFRFDESGVREFNMAMYGDLYPEQYKFKYPKAGEDNALVTIHIYDLASRKTLDVDTGEETDQYIARMQWTPDNSKLALMRLNRLQNEISILLADPASGESDAVLVEKNDTYWDVDITHHASDRWHFLNNSTDFLWASDRSGYSHIYRYSREGELLNQLTEGEFDVMDIAAVDEENDNMYFVSAEVSPLERHLYVCKLNGKKKKRLSTEEGTHDFTFSSANNFYVDSYSSTTDPGYTILRKANGKAVKTLVDNKDLRERMAGLDIADPEFFDFETSEGVSLNGWMIKPSDFDASKKYPVLMFCYGGPASQTVKNAWGHGRPFNYMWYQMLAQQGYVIVSVDNRGTGARGSEFLKSTYADLGRLETIDQIEAAKYLQQQSYVDADRIGIWGWSFGGYLTSLCMVKGGGLFKAGIAVAPVTNWRFYDTIYTERYLKRPQENAKGYDENSPINFAKDLQGAYLLIHGTADDNVHYQNSLEWVNALVNANKQFDMFFYPNKNHGIYGGITRYHLFKKMTDFVLENL
jgi:dipeptidyl-peptidase-4